VSDKLFWMRFVINDWRQDTRVLSAAARGVWFEMICSVFPIGDKTLTEAQWLRELGVTQAEFTEALAEIRSHNIADVQVTDKGEVRVVSRRRVREEKERTANALYQARHREKLNSKTDIRDMSGTELESKRKKEKDKTPDRVSHSLSDTEAPKGNGQGLRWKAKPGGGIEPIGSILDTVMPKDKARTS